MRLKKLDIQTIKKEKLVQICFYAGILLAFFGSLHPWFLWPLGTLYPLPSGLLIGTAMLISKTTKDNWFAARPSGTENIYKVYAESFESPEALDKVLAEATEVVDKALAE